MPEGVGYGPQFTASVGKTLNYIGRHAYAYSGNITNTGTAAPDSVMLDFVTGSDSYLKGKFQWEANHEGSLTVDIVIEFNGVKIYDSEFDASPGRGMWLTPLRVIIPPGTHVRMLWGASSAQEAASQFTGRVYGKIQ